MHLARNSSHCTQVEYLASMLAIDGEQFGGSSALSPSSLVSIYKRLHQRCDGTWARC